MSFKPVIRAFIQIASLLFLMLGLLLGYAYFKTNQAQSQAEAVCKLVPIGTSLERVKAVIERADTDPRLKRSRENDFAWVSFHGAGTDRWMCNLSIRNGSVVSQEIRLLD